MGDVLSSCHGVEVMGVLGTKLSRTRWTFRRVWTTRRPWRRRGRRTIAWTSTRTKRMKLTWSRRITARTSTRSAVNLHDGNATETGDEAYKDKMDIPKGVDNKKGAEEKGDDTKYVGVHDVSGIKCIESMYMLWSAMYSNYEILCILCN